MLSILVLRAIKNNYQKQQEEYLAHHGKIANIYVKQMSITDTIKDEGKKF